VQRDYVFGWIVSGIFRESGLAGRATLKGGNALRKGYLPGTCFSDDLDFSTRDSLDGGAVLAELNRVCEFEVTDQTFEPRFEVTLSKAGCIGGMSAVLDQLGGIWEIATTSNPAELGPTGLKVSL
jgi:predicted nucleotidyltransferase component of viral defense system